MPYHAASRGPLVYEKNGQGSISLHLGWGGTRTDDKGKRGIRDRSEQESRDRGAVERKQGEGGEGKQRPVPLVPFPFNRFS